MRDSVARCVPARAHARGQRTASASRPLLALLTAMALAGCAIPDSNPFTVFADPGKYEFHSCDQIAAQRKSWSSREQELRALMNKAEQNAGGVVVNLLAYKADHVAASEELKVLEAAARSKRCDAPANARGN